MGKLKFEKEFSKKLKSREIEPKEESWEQLNKRLGSSVEKTKAPSFWWIGIAGAIVGGIFIFGNFFNEPESIYPGIVVTPVEKLEQKENKIQQNSSEEVKPEEITFEEEEIIATTAREKALKISEEQKPTLKNINSAVAVVDEEIELEDPIMEEPDVIVAKEPEISQSIQDAIAEVILQESRGDISDTEVDALLAKAAVEISQTTSDKFSSENIDASSLLREVEFEMEESFRDKVFEVLKEGYLKARTAVANRNN